MLSIITLNVNGLNGQTIRQSLAEWIQKQDPYICCLQKTHLKIRDTYRLKVKGWKKILHKNRDQKKAGVARLTSDKIDFKIKAVKRDKEGHYIMIKRSIQEDITIINIYAPNIATGEGNGTPFQYSCLENPMDRGAWWAAVHGVAESLVFLPGESHGQRSPAGYSP